ncbi:hypothetical protein [Rhodoblastus sp.]|uniref:hypothetical protein n=1 Tax=Rhodoblastus sp. TaxID=1962975 RepID=UPI00260B0758|nr:hypothetical protein [Rhodoblastus sp.]
MSRKNASFFTDRQAVPAQTALAVFVLSRRPSRPTPSSQRNQKIAANASFLVPSRWNVAAIDYSTKPQDRQAAVEWLAGTFVPVWRQTAFARRHEAGADRKGARATSLVASSGLRAIHYVA